MAKKYVYFFGKGRAEGRAVMKDLLGGKGSNLAEMTALGVPVPPGFTMTTEACVEFMRRKGKYPPGLWEQVRRSLARLEKVMGARFGDPENPLLVSVRSGARVSMPGMMDTVLNLGLNYLLIPLLLSLGAALATLLSFIVMAGTAYVISERLLPLPYELGRVAKLFLVAFALYGAGLALPPLPLPYAVPLKVLLAATFPVALLSVRFYTPDEIGMLRTVTLTLRARLSLLTAR